MPVERGESRGRWERGKEQGEGAGEVVGGEELKDALVATMTTGFKCSATEVEGRY